MLSNRHLDRLQILPFAREEQMGTARGWKATIKRVEVHQDTHVCHESAHSCSLTAQDGPTRPRSIVVKTYPEDKEKSYNAERAAYAALSKASNIVKCLGSFYWVSEDRRRFSSLLLEDAPDGSLLDLYRTEKPPYTFADIRAFWENFPDMIAGLERIHNHARSSDFSGYAL